MLFSLDMEQATDVVGVGLHLLHPRCHAALLVAAEKHAQEILSDGTISVVIWQLPGLYSLAQISAKGFETKMCFSYWTSSGRSLPVSACLSLLVS